MTPLSDGQRPSALDETLVDLLPTAVYVSAAPAGEIVKCNPRAVSLWGEAPATGATVDDFHRRHRLSQLDGTPVPTEAAPMIRALREGRAIHDTELLVVRADGSRISIVVDVDVLQDQDGRIVGALNVFQDVTDRRRIETALQRSELRLRRVLDTLPVGAYTCDPQGRIAHFNRQAAEVWGREPKLGDDVDRFCGSFRLYSADGRPLAHEECWMALALRDGRDYTEQEIIIERPDGERRTILAHASPLRDEDGSLAGGLNILVDITARKRMEEDLRASEAHLQAVIETSPDCVTVINPEGCLVAMNSAGLRMMQAGDLESVISTSIHALIAPEHREAFAAFHDRVCSGTGGRLQFDLIGLRGARRSMESHAAPLRQPGHDAFLHLALTRDVTRRKRAEEALRDADQRKNEFLAVLAHELRNPLAPLRSGLEILRATGDDPAALRRVRGTMERQVAHLVRLVDDLLDVSRITCGKIELRREPTALGGVLSSAVETVRPLIDERGHDLIIEVPDPAVVLLADATRLAQVFSNILNNAGRYTPPGGRLTLSAITGPDSVAIEVGDSGCGIESAMLERIFDMFTQGNESGHSGGLGIGLTLARSLVALHGGTITVSSEGAGRGSCFRIELPLAGGDDGAGADAPGREFAPEPLVTGDDPGGTSLPTRRILLVDDNVDAAETLAMLLESMGQTVQAVHTGRAAIEAAPQFAPDLILLDIGLPDMSGYEVARQLRGSFPLVALTGWGQLRDRNAARAAGFDHHLVKPVPIAVLEHLLRSV